MPKLAFVKSNLSVNTFSLFSYHLNITFKKYLPLTIAFVCAKLNGNVAKTVDKTKRLVFINQIIEIQSWGLLGVF
jgi:hypothetical protein